MNKENNRSAAGLRRSAIAERIRLREEWSELKGTPDQSLTASNRHARVLVKPQVTGRNLHRRPVGPKSVTKRNIINANVAKSVQMSSEVLVGVVALVEVGAESRALALRAALSALGASVVPAWTPIVTHLVWAQGGCRATRAKARALASRLVSPLWVEACAASSKRLPEQAFPAAARASDLPSPRTLRQLLKKAEMENIDLLDLLSDENDDNGKAPHLRLSSETELDTTDTSHDTSKDTSRDTTKDTSRDTSHDTSRNKTESRVNTAPRRALPVSISPAPPAKSRRKLFTQKEAQETRTKASDDDEEEPKAVVPTRKRRIQVKPSQRERRELARAERMARRLAAPPAPAPAPAPAPPQPPQPPQPGAPRPRIVLTGMGKSERQSVTNSVRSLNGRLQSHVTAGWKTTHVLLGSCREDDNQNTCSGVPATANLSGVTSLEARVVHRSEVQKARTVSALGGAARGCRVLGARWAADSARAGRWLHHHGYEVPHLKKMSQKARIERIALGRMRSDYAYDVFNGMRVFIEANTEQKEAATSLLKLCGGIPLDGASGENGGMEFDMKIGAGDGEVSSKWVFDSIAAGRMRTTRRYMINSSFTQTNR